VETPFSAYQGDEPYIFVCYAHDDAALVYPEITRLHEAGFHVWYDEGVSPGSEWSESLAQHIEQCVVLLYFVTPKSVEREHCRQEINFALDQHCTILPVHLEETQMPSALKLSLSHRQAILKHEHPSKAYEEKLDHALETAVFGRAETLDLDAVPVSAKKAPSTQWIKYLGVGLAITVVATLIVLMLPRIPEDQAATTGIPRVAVMPFENQSEDPEQRYFSQGLSEEIATALSRFAILSVVPPLLAAKYDDPNIAADERSVRYLVRGSVRRSASEVRVSASLVDSRNDSQLWAETYDRELNAANLFDVQAEIAERIAATLAAASGVVVNIGLQEARRRPTNSLLAYDCVLRGQAYIAIHNEETHRVARDCLEEAVKIDPNYADALAHLAFLYEEEDQHQFNVRPKSLDRSLEMAQRALELDSSNVVALMAIGTTYAYGRHELDIGRIYMERGLAINPNNTTLLSHLTWIEILAGDIEKGFEYADRVRELDPAPPMWLYNGVATGHYLRGEYERALLELSNRVPYSDAQAEVLRAASLGMLGRRDEARQVLDELIKADPQSPQRIFREFVNTEAMNDLADGLAKAGLQMELPLPRQGNPKNN